MFHILKRCIKKYQYLYIFNIASEFSRHCFLYAHDGFMDKFKKLQTLHYCHKNEIKHDCIGPAVRSQKEFAASCFFSLQSDIIVITLLQT